MTLVLRYAARSDRGLVRANNEDSVYAGARLLALADGMGGHAAGEVASQLVIAALAHLDDDEPGGDLLSALNVAVHDGNSAIAAHVEEDPELEGMGTTLTAILFAGNRLGLVHIGDLSWERVRKVEDVVKVGDAVRVQVLGIETNHDPPRISLGMKQLGADPFTSAAGDLAQGSVVTGTVTRLTDFGAFVQVAPGVEGLVHISEMAHERVHKPSQVVKAGEVVKVQVMEVDPGRQRVSLSIKRVGGDAAAAAERAEDPSMRKLLAKFDGKLKGGLG